MADDNIEVAITGIVSKIELDQTALTQLEAQINQAQLKLNATKKKGAGGKQEAKNQAAEVNRLTEAYKRQNEALKEQRRLLTELRGQKTTAAYEKSVASFSTRDERFQRESRRVRRAEQKLEDSELVKNTTTTFKERLDLEKNSYGKSLAQRRAYYASLQRLNAQESAKIANIDLDNLTRNSRRELATAVANRKELVARLGRIDTESPDSQTKGGLFSTRANRNARQLRGLGRSETLLATKGGVARDIASIGSVVDLAGGGGPAGAAVVGLSAAVAKLTATYTDYIDKVRVVSAQTGVAAQEAAKFVSVFDDLGINSDRAAAALFQFTKYLDEDRVKKYGIEVARLANGNVNVVETFLNLSERINQTNDAAERANITYAALGRIGATVLPVLELGPEVLRQRFGTVPTVNARDLQSQRELKLAVAALREEFIGLSIDVGRIVVPALTKVTSTVSGLFNLLSTDPTKNAKGLIALDRIGAFAGSIVDNLPGLRFEDYFNNRAKELEKAVDQYTKDVQEIGKKQQKGEVDLVLKTKKRADLERVALILGTAGAGGLLPRKNNVEFDKSLDAFTKLSESDLPAAQKVFDQTAKTLEQQGRSAKQAKEELKDYRKVLDEATTSAAIARLSFITLADALADPSFGLVSESLAKIQSRGDLIFNAGKVDRAFSVEDIGLAVDAADKQQEAQLSVLELKEEIRLKQLEINEVESQGAAKQSDAVQKQIDALQATTRSDQASLRKINRSREDVDYQRSLVAGRKSLTDAEREYQYALEDQGTAARALAASERELEKVKRENSPEANARKEALALRELRDARFSLVDAEKDYTRAVEDRALLDRSVNRAIEDHLELNESARRSEYDAVEGVKDAEKALKDLYVDQSDSVEKLNEALERRNSLLGDGKFNTLEELIGPASKIIVTKPEDDPVKKLEAIEKAQERLRRQQYDLNKLRQTDSIRQTQDADQAVLSAQRARVDGLTDLERKGIRLGDQRGDLIQKEKDTAQSIKDIPIDAQLAIESQTLEVRKSRRGIEQELLDIEDKKKGVDEARYGLAVLQEQADIKAINRRIEDRDLQIEGLERNKKDLEDLEKKSKATKDYSAEVAVLNAQLQIASRQARGEVVSSVEINDLIRAAKAKALGGRVDTVDSIITGPVTSDQAYRAAIANSRRGRSGVSSTEAYDAARKGNSGTFGDSSIVSTFIDPVIGAGRLWLDEIYPNFKNSIDNLQNKDLNLTLQLKGKNPADEAILKILNGVPGAPGAFGTPLTTGRWKGGPMRQGDVSWVSEAGPELFRTKDGQLLSLGGGPSLFQAPVDGQVLTALQSSKLLSALRNGSTSYSTASSSSIVNSNNKSVTVKVEAATSSGRKQGRDVGREIVKAIRNL